MNIKVERERRKNFRLEHSEDGKFLARVPYNADEKEVEDFLRKHRIWIKKRNEEFMRVSEMRRDLSSKRKRNFLFMGNEYEVSVSDSTRCFDFDGIFHVSPGCVEDVVGHFKRFCRNELLQVLDRRVPYYSRKLGLEYSKYTIGSSITMWASCDKSRRLRFSWRLAMAPPEVIDYVIVHELVHTEMFLHDRTFYERVGKEIPDWKEKKMWLRKNSAKIRLMTDQKDPSNGSK
ncbi:MAG: M48 family metallopeptidase [Cuniculiplasma sp.]